jgi:hypothetical protein
MSLSLAAPPPPLALFRGQARIARLSHCRPKHIQHANILVLPSYPSEIAIEPVRISPCQFRNASHAKQVEISQHRWTHRNQILKLS